MASNSKKSSIIIHELYTNGAYDVYGYVDDYNQLIGKIVRSNHPSVADIGERISWPIYRYDGTIQFKLYSTKKDLEDLTEELEKEIG